MSVSPDPSTPVAGEQLRRHELNGTSATYLVREVRGALTLVEVVDAPGLAAGMRFRFATTAVAAMAIVAPAVAAPTRGARFVRAA
jgi:hypothetical protein